MKILEKVKEIFEKQPIEYVDIKIDNLYEFDDKNYTKYHTDKERDLFKKYDKYIPHGWYGFAIGNPIIPQWLDLIDKVLDLCIDKDPSFEIHQIKLKYGGIRFYCESSVIEDLFEVESYIEIKLFDEKLIY